MLIIPQVHGTLLLTPFRTLSFPHHGWLLPVIQVSFTFPMRPSLISSHHSSLFSFLPSTCHNLKFDVHVLFTCLSFPAPSRMHEQGLCLSYSLLFPRCLEQCLPHSWWSRNISRLNKSRSYLLCNIFQLS